MPDASSPLKLADEAESVRIHSEPPHHQARTTTTAAAAMVGRHAPVTPVPAPMITRGSKRKLQASLSPTTDIVMSSTFRHFNERCELMAALIAHHCNFFRSVRNLCLRAMNDEIIRNMYAYAVASYVVDEDCREIRFRPLPFVHFFNCRDHCWLGMQSCTLQTVEETRAALLDAIQLRLQELEQGTVALPSHSSPTAQHQHFMLYSITQIFNFPDSDARRELLTCFTIHPRMGMQFLIVRFVQLTYARIALPDKGQRLFDTKVLPYYNNYFDLVQFCIRFIQSVATDMQQDRWHEYFTPDDYSMDVNEDLRFQFFDYVDPNVPIQERYAINQLPAFAHIEQRVIARNVLIPRPEAMLPPPFADIKPLVLNAGRVPPGLVIREEIERNEYCSHFKLIRLQLRQFRQKCRRFGAGSLTNLNELNERIERHVYAKPQPQQQPQQQPPQPQPQPRHQSRPVARGSQPFPADQAIMRPPSNVPRPMRSRSRSRSRGPINRPRQMVPQPQRQLQPTPKRVFMVTRFTDTSAASSSTSSVATASRSIAATTVTTTNNLANNTATVPATVPATATSATAYATATFAATAAAASDAVAASSTMAAEGDVPADAEAGSCTEPPLLNYQFEIKPRGDKLVVTRVLIREPTTTTITTTTAGKQPKRKSSPTSTSSPNALSPNALSPRTSSPRISSPRTSSPATSPAPSPKSTVPRSAPTPSKQAKLSLSPKPQRQPKPSPLQLSPKQPSTSQQQQLLETPSSPSPPTPSPPLSTAPSPLTSPPPPSPLSSMAPVVNSPHLLELHLQRSVTLPVSVSDVEPPESVYGDDDNTMLFIDESYIAPPTPAPAPTPAPPMLTEEGRVVTTYKPKPFEDDISFEEDKDDEAAAREELMNIDPPASSDHLPDAATEAVDVKVEIDFEWGDAPPATVKTETAQAAETVPEEAAAASSTLKPLDLTVAASSPRGQSPCDTTSYDTASSTLGENSSSSISPLKPSATSSPIPSFHIPPLSASAPAALNPEARATPAALEHVSAADAGQEAADAEQEAVDVAQMTLVEADAPKSAPDSAFDPKSPPTSTTTTEIVPMDETSPVAATDPVDGPSPPRNAVAQPTAVAQPATVAQPAIVATTQRRRPRRALLIPSTYKLLKLNKASCYCTQRFRQSVGAIRKRSQTTKRVAFSSHHSSIKMPAAAASPSSAASSVSNSSPSTLPIKMRYLRQLREQSAADRVADYTANTLTPTLEAMHLTTTDTTTTTTANATTTTTANATSTAAATAPGAEADTGTVADAALAGGTVADSEFDDNNYHHQPLPPISSFHLPSSSHQSQFQLQPMYQGDDYMAAATNTFNPTLNEQIEYEHSLRLLENYTRSQRTVEEYERRYKPMHQHPYYWLSPPMTTTIINESPSAAAASMASSAAPVIIGAYSAAHLNAAKASQSSYAMTSTTSSVAATSAVATAEHSDEAAMNFDAVAVNSIIASDENEKK